VYGRSARKIFSLLRKIFVRVQNRFTGSGRTKRSLVHEPREPVRRAGRAPEILHIPHVEGAGRLARRTRARRGDCEFAGDSHIGKLGITPRVRINETHARVDPEVGLAESTDCGQVQNRFVTARHGEKECRVWNLFGHNDTRLNNLQRYRHLIRLLGKRRAVAAIGEILDILNCGAARHHQYDTGKNEKQLPSHDNGIDEE